MEEGKLSKAESPQSIFFNLQIGSVIVELVIDDSNPTSAVRCLNFVRNVEGFMHCFPRFTAQMNRLFVLGRSVGFDKPKFNCIYNPPLPPGMYLYSCCNMDSPNLVQWNLVADLFQVTVVTPYLVQVGDMLCMFGGSDKTTPGCASDIWGCVVNCKDHSLSFLQPLPEVVGTRTVSHFLWKKKVYLFCKPARGSKNAKRSIISYDLETERCSLEKDMTEKLEHTFRHSKLVVFSSFAAG